MLDVLSKQALDRKAQKLHDKIKDLETERIQKTARFKHSCRKGALGWKQLRLVLRKLNNRINRVIDKLRSEHREMLIDDNYANIHNGAKRFKMESTRSAQIDEAVKARFGDWR